MVRTKRPSSWAYSGKDKEAWLKRCPSCGMEGEEGTYGEVCDRSLTIEPLIYVSNGAEDNEVKISPQTEAKMAAPDLVWSKDSYNVSSLMAKYSDKFPIIVQVTKGYCGKDDNDTLALSQVARLQTWRTQQRVRAQDSHGRKISIPLTYIIEFEILKVKNGKRYKRSKPKKLADIIKKHELPLLVQFAKHDKSHFRIGPHRYFTKTFGTIELQRVYEERFLIGNTIHRGAVVTKVMLLPMYVKVTFKVATGIVDGTEEEWKALQNTYTKALANINFDAITGTQDMLEYTDPDPGNAKDDVDYDANANLTTVENRETLTTHSQPNGDVPHANKESVTEGTSKAGSVSVTVAGQTGGHGISSTSGDSYRIPRTGKLIMEVPKNDLKRSGPLQQQQQRDQHETRGGTRSDLSDVSSISGAVHPQNIVRVSLSDGANVISEDTYDRDFSYNAPIVRHRPVSSSVSSSGLMHGSCTVINVSDDHTHILNNSLPPSMVFGAPSWSDSNLRRTYSENDFYHNNSVFLSASPSVHYIDDVPSYATTGRRYKQNYPSYSSTDLNTFSRHGRRKYGQTLVGGAPLVVDRQYHSMKDLSRIDNYETSVSRVPSFRSATLTPSPSPTRHPQNLYLRLTDDGGGGGSSRHAPTGTFVRRIELSDDEPFTRAHYRFTSSTSAAPPVTYTRRAGVERATKVANQTAPTRIHRERTYNQGVYFTDGYNNYTVPTKVRRPPPPAYDTIDNVELIEEDYTVEESPPPAVAAAAAAYNHQGPQSPVLSSSSNEDTKRYLIVYENGTGEDEVIEATENADYLYQGSMMLRKGRDYDDGQFSIGEGSMISIPVEDNRSLPVTTGSRRSASTSNVQRSHVHRVESAMRPAQHTRVEKVERVRRVHHTAPEAKRRVYDVVDSGGGVDYSSSSMGFVDMTKGAAEHWGRVMDADGMHSSYTRHRVPVEMEGRSTSSALSGGGINEGMFEGGHHSFTTDRQVCRRLDVQRQERSHSHREQSQGRARRIAHSGVTRSGSSGSSRRQAYSNVIKVDTDRAPLYASHSYHRHSESGGGGGGGGGRRHHTQNGGMAYEFRSSNKEVVSSRGSGAGMRGSFGMAPLTSEYMSSALLKEAEALEDGGAASGGARDEMQGRKGSTSSYSESTVSRSSSSQSGELAINGGAANAISRAGGASEAGGGERSKGSYDLAALDLPTIEVSGTDERAADLKANERISRKKARELTRTGSVRSLREVYARSRSPSGSHGGESPGLTLAADTDVFSDILNMPGEGIASASAAAGGGGAGGAGGGVASAAVSSSSNSAAAGSQSMTSSVTRNVIMRAKPVGRSAYKSASSSSSRHMVSSRGGEPASQEGELAWQETQSYHLESIRDSIRDLDEYLKNQGGDTDSHSLSSATSSKHLEHFSYALTEDPATY